ncbi:MAG: biotin--[acetyl-CoA-carboxylase] ligase [Chloroflexota bacterium]
MSLDQPLTEPAIRAALETNWLGHALYVYERVGSTNTVLARLAEEGAPTGTMVIAEYQAEGRGRQERRWQAPAGSSLLLSLLFRPRWPARQAHWFTMLAGLAAATAIEARSSLRAALKWPNDVMIWDERYGEPQWRKAGGILLETQLDQERLTRVVLGIGLNVNIPGADLPAGATPATSLLAAGGRPLARIPILTRLLQALESRYEEADAGISPQPAWNERLVTRDQNVRVTTANEVIQGQALGSDEWGRLIVRTPDGEIRRFSAGDVTLR